MKRCYETPFSDSNYVKPLALAENEFLQVLVDKFRISRTGHGFELIVDIDDSTPAIWLREAKSKIQSLLPVKKRLEVQKSIDEFFRSDEDTYHYHDPSFPFRLGNGGTLPIIRMKGTDYYCLFYRDIHPVGWNIANGGANTKHDILHPDAIVERELREELIIVEPKQGRWHIFDWHDARLHDHPDFAMAQELWMERFRKRGYRTFEKVMLPLKWSLPPDIDLSSLNQFNHDAMSIRYEKGPGIYTDRGFLNINAEDFGIEFDRIAKISMNQAGVICDGELRNNRLLDQVVGLFSVHKIHEEMEAGHQQFFPDRVYWNGEDRTGEDLESVIEAYLRTRGSSFTLVRESVRMVPKPKSKVELFGFCPVTRNIIQRHKDMISQFESPKPHGRPYNVFLSFASEDRSLANQVYDHLSNVPGVNVFFSDVTMTCGGFTDQIDQALDSVSSFIAVGTKEEHLKKSWVKYEWQNFFVDLMSKRKPTNSPYFAIVSGMDPKDLPRPLRQQTAVRLDHDGFEEALKKATKRLSRD